MDCMEGELSLGMEISVCSLRLFQLGFILAGYPGVVAAIVSSIVEHYEFPPYIDDNVLITLASSLILISSKILLGV